jgi:hypothetical protein
MAAMPKAIEAWREEQSKARTKTELQKLLSVPVTFVKELPSLTSPPFLLYLDGAIGAGTAG